MITTVIIDDEPGCLEALKTLIENFCPQIQVVGLAKDAIEGISLISRHQPDLLFLDIRMPGFDGFGLLNHLKNPTFKVIFTSAFDDHVINAMRYAKLDYLLKPIGIKELNAAISHYVPGNLQGLPFKGQASALPKKIAIPSLQGYDFIDADNIIWIEAAEAYTRFHLTYGQPVVASSHLKKFEKMLDAGLFLRIHYSHIINVQHVKKYIRSKNAYVIMSNGKELDVSGRRKDIMLKMIGGCL